MSVPALAIPGTSYCMLENCESLGSSSGPVRVIVVLLRGRTLAHHPPTRSLYRHTKFSHLRPQPVRSDPCLCGTCLTSRFSPTPKRDKLQLFPRYGEKEIRTCYPAGGSLNDHII